MNPNQILITINEGNVSVEGPINDKMFCYAALELAKDAVRAFAEKAEKGNGPLIVPASPHIRLT